MDLTTFIEHIAEYQDRILKIATDNNFAILLMATIGEDDSGGAQTTGVTNMDKTSIACAHLYQSSYAQKMYTGLIE